MKKVEISLAEGCEPALWKTESVNVHFWNVPSVLWSLYFPLEPGLWRHRRFAMAVSDFPSCLRWRRSVHLSVWFWTWDPEGGTRGGRDSLMWILSSGAVVRRGDPGSWSSAGHSLGSPGGLTAEIPCFHCRQDGAWRGMGGSGHGSGKFHMPRGVAKKRRIYLHFHLNKVIDAKSRLIGKDPNAGKDWGREEKRATEDEMVGWHHRLTGHEFEQTPGDSEGQGSLKCSVHGVAKTWTRLSNWTTTKGDLGPHHSLGKPGPEDCGLLAGRWCWGTSTWWPEVVWWDQWMLWAAPGVLTISLLSSFSHSFMWAKLQILSSFAVESVSRSVAFVSCDLLDYSPPGSFVNGILQVRRLEWVAIPFSRGSCWPRDQTWVSCFSGLILHH